MAESAVSVLADQLSAWLLEERKLLGGLTVEAQIIRDELEQMRAFLRVADESEETDHQLKEWVRQVRRIAYDIEDVLEDYMLRFAHYPANGIVGRVKRVYASIKQLKAKHKIATEVKALRSRVESASKTFSSLYSVLPRPNSSGVANDTYYDGQGDALLLEEADVVGIERPKKELLQWISTTDYTLKVVSVVGMAGLGKTTLVKKVYDDPSLKKDIDHHAWITVSKAYKVENLLIEMVKQLLAEVKQVTPHDLENMNADALRKFVRDFLVNESYLIVLDDVWSTNAWGALFYAFPRSTTCGRGCVIITTRLTNVGNAASCHCDGQVYNLQPLPPKESRELFYKKAFRGEASCPQHLKEISENILKSCNGLPLAVVVIGGILATKRNDIGELTKVGKNFKFDLGNDLKRIEKVLSLSYYDLPYYLKPCFLYLSIFPEDQLLGRDTIIRLWIAEGFVKEKQGKSMEEIADGYLNELFNRSLIQVAGTSDDGRPLNFRIHDLVREYIISKAIEQNMVMEKEAKEMFWNGQWIRLDDDSRSQIMQIDNFKHLRSLLFFGSVNLEWGSILGKVFHGGCRMLKELDLRGLPSEEIPNEVFKLYHLKYLSLRGTNVSIISKSIGNLVKLVTLDLMGSKVTKLPIEVLKLRRLRHLLVFRYKTHKVLPIPFANIHPVEVPYEIGQLLCLQELCYVDASVNYGEGIKLVRELGKLTTLRKLAIVRLRKEDGKELSSSLAELSYIAKLDISSLDEDEVIDLQDCMSHTSLQSLRELELTGRLEKVPQWIPSLDALTVLRLKWSKMDEDPLESLQALPNLHFLLMNLAYEGEGLSFKCGGFQRLKILHLQCLRGLKWVRVEKGSMPCLDTFTVLDCKAMLELPLGIEHLTSLNTVGFVNMAKDFLKALSDEKERDGDRWRLGHIPRLEIAYWVDGIWKPQHL